MGQVLLKAHAAEAAPTPATRLSAVRFSEDFSLSVGVVTHFLEGSLEELNIENDLLHKVQAELNGPCADPTPPVADKDRYMCTDHIDRMIDEVSLVFAVFGLGGLTDPFSFASVVQECKTTLRAIDGLGGADRQELKFGEHFGLQNFMFAAMRCGGLTLQQLFRTDDPLLEVQRSKFLQFGPMAFKKRLAGLHEAVAARQHDQRVFGSRSHASGNQTAVMERRIAALEAQLSQGGGKVKGGTAGQGSPAPVSQSPAAPPKSKGKKRPAETKERERTGSKVDSASWVGHLRAGGTWYEVHTLREILASRYNFSRSEASLMCFAYGLDPRSKGSEKQRSCPCPRASGHARPGDRCHKFPANFCDEIPRIYQDFR
jgi:hypothetical protein